MMIEWSSRAAMLLVMVAVACPARADKKPVEETVPGERDLIAPSVASNIVNAPTPQEQETLEEERAKDLDTMIRRARDFGEIVDGMVRRVYEMRREHIDESYQSKIEAEEALEMESLKDAIANFEAFLKKYPKDPPYTPDAMFRLAELHYDMSYINYLEKLDKFGEAQERGTDGDMELPVKEFDRTISLFQSLVRDYPEYRNMDGAYYLLGYCLNDTGKEKEARLAQVIGVYAVPGFVLLLGIAMWWWRRR
jgi:TolA-binding protein